MPHSSFSSALVSPGPAADRAEKMKLYGWLVGDWIFDAIAYEDDGTRRTGKGEIHAAWALDGRAIMDVWILPGYFYGTTLRVYDPTLDAWHIYWSDPLKQLYTYEIGHREGQDVVQSGDLGRGMRARWRFSEIAADSFRWTGERSFDGGATWQLQADYRAKRTA